ncbi:MAG TPA: hypothetical protein VHC97_05615 [Thermoanaerobaculia bacterium]|jgi:hypothetical protein|nr:hypothetical protein [Thermoanaerobaculia bacterium]
MRFHERQSLLKREVLALAVLFLWTAGAALAVVPPKGTSPLAARAFRHPDLYISSAYRQVGQVPEPLASALRQDLQALGVAESGGYVDLRTGSWGTLVLRQPLIPGSGKGNTLTWQRQAPGDTTGLEQAAWDAFQSYLVAHQAALNVAPGALGQRTVKAVSGGQLIYINVRQSAAGVPVRDSFLTAVVNNGNLVLFGSRNWGAVAVPTQPAVSQQAAISAAEAYAGRVFSTYWSAPHLEIVPVAQGRDALASAVGQGLRHRLVWAMGPRFSNDHGTWEALVDAHSGEVIAFTDRNEYLKTAKGGIFPLSNDGNGPEGTEQANHPMPYVDLTDATGKLFFGDGSGDLSCSVHTSPLRTKLSGRFVNIFDNCGAIDETENFPAGIDLGSGPGTDCTVPAGHSPGDTHSARTGFYELNRLIEQTKGWLPDNTWLKGQLTANMNIEDTCNAFWNGSTVNFYRLGGGCRNTGEIAAVFDHEWGHGLDNNDANPSISSPGEAYADVSAIVRLNTSCIGRGFYEEGTCGGNGDACTECSGVREVDWTKRASGVPHNLDWNNEDPLDPNGLRGGCRIDGAGSTSVGPCGNGTHCEGSMASEGVWDLIKRDLPGFGGAGFAIDANTALEMVSRYYYTAGGALGNWYNCNPVGPVGNYGDGCNADGVYLNFLAADDDNGDLTDGTPHMPAIFAAWDRHQIACPTPAVVSSGCAGRPTTAPVVTVTPLFKGANLSWTPVAGATKYWVYRTEGVLGCSFGKTRIAETADTRFFDTGLQNGRQYFYSVVPVGASDSCMGPMSACANVTPGGAAGALAFTSRTPALTGVSGGDGDSVIDNCETGTVSFEVTNSGDAALTNVRVSRVEAVSHPEIQILSTPAVASSLAPCSNAAGTFQFRAAGIHSGDKVVFRVYVTANELASGEVSRTAEIAGAESDFDPVASRTWSFDTGRDGWRVVHGTFDHDTGPGANLAGGFLKSSSLQDNQCDEIESPVVRLTAGSTLSLFNQFVIEPGTEPTGGFFDRANVGLRDQATGGRTTVVPDGGRLYTASGPNGVCATAGQPGWAGLGPLFQQSTWSTGALNPASAFTGKIVTLDVAYGTDTTASLAGFQLDEVTLTNFEEQVPDRQSDVCRVCTSIDDADPAVGYRSGWHRVSSPAASGGGYHRRMGSGTNSVARVVFTGDQITYFFARSNAGGTADVFIDGVLKGTVSYFSASVTPTFGHSVAYSGLGAGSHELRIEPRSGAVYVDGFELCTGGGANASAVQYRSVTQTSTGTLSLTPLTRTVQMGPNDEEISVVVEGMAGPVTVQLLNSLGSVIASGGALLPGFTASGLDKTVPAPGTYTVKVLNTLGLTSNVTVSIARTVRVQ